jgi:heme oxygenase (biliverdin-producing, ferredoxin)
MGGMTPASTSAPAPAAPPFSTVIRDASHAQHTEAENSSFVGDLLGGALGLDSYVRYTEQLWWLYHALEAPASALADDPVAGPFVRRELFRVASLERDLDHLHTLLDGRADDWRASVSPLPATAAYARRVTEVARDWPGGYVAHHYTRYLGDLSGGQVIRATAERLWGLTHKGDGVRFYVFDDIPNPAAFKREYRALLDAVPVDDAEKDRIVGECRRAFSLNTAVFGELAPKAPESAGS